MDNENIDMNDCFTNSVNEQLPSKSLSELDTKQELEQLKNSFNSTTLEFIMSIIERYRCKSIFYIGKANKEIVLAIKKQCSITLSDWYDVTHKQAHFWWDEEDCGPVENCPSIPEWARDVGVMIEGMPDHDLLLLDIKILDNDYLEYCNKAKIVILFDDAEFDNFYHKDLYKWYNQGLWLGFLKHEPTNLHKQFHEVEIAGQKTKIHIDEAEKTVSLQLVL